MASILTSNFTYEERTIFQSLDVGITDDDFEVLTIWREENERAKRKKKEKRREVLLLMVVQMIHQWTHKVGGKFNYRLIVSNG